MKFTYYVNPQTPGPDGDVAIIDHSIMSALRASEDGFAAINLTEHHFTNFNTYSDPFMLGSYLAPQIGETWLSIGVAVVPLHQPLRLAEKCNILDLLTRGRCIIGVGPGGAPRESGGFGRTPADRNRLMAEGLDIMMRAWAHQESDSPLEFDTGFDKGRMEGRIMPGSWRKPHPMIARATNTDQTIVDCGLKGMPVMVGRFTPEEGARKLKLYADALEAGENDAATVKSCLDWMAVTKAVHVAETDEQAWREIEEPLDNYMAFGNQIIIKDASKGVAGDYVNTGVSMTDKAQYAKEAMIVGSPETVIRQIREYEAAGIHHLRSWFSWGFNRPEVIDRSYRLFVDEVMPAFDVEQINGTAATAPALTAAI